MNLLAIDPGHQQSAWVYLTSGMPTAFDIVGNDVLLEFLDDTDAEHLAIEGIQSFGMTVGAEVFETCYWVGRFMERFGADRTTLVYRKDVKLHLCHSCRAKDPNVRQALIDRFGPDKKTAIGTKQNKGPLYGIHSHCWSALAIACTYFDKNATRNTVEARA